MATPASGVEGRTFAVRFASSGMKNASHGGAQWRDHLRPEQLLWWLLAAVIALLSALLWWMIVTPVSPLGNWRPTDAQAPPVAARASLFASINPFNRGQGVAAVQPAGEVITALPLTLFGTRMNRGSGAGSAIIAGADGVQNVFRTGTEVMPGVKLHAVGFDYVALDNAGVIERLYLDQSSAPTQTAASGPEATQVSGIPGQDQAAAGSGGVNLDSLRDNVSFQPISNGGRISGLAVSANGDDAAMRAAGLIPGDVVTSINGKPVSGAGDASGALGALSPGQPLTIEVNRGGQVIPLTIDVK